MKQQEKCVLQLSATQLQQFLKKLPFFQSFTTEELSSISQFFQIIFFAPEELILQQGEPGHCLYIIEKGTVELSLRKPGDLIRILQLLGPGVLFGEVSMLTRSMVIASAKALEPTTCFALTSDKLDLIRSCAPTLSQKIEHSIAYGAAERISSTLQQANALFEALQNKRTLSALNPPLRWYVSDSNATCRDEPDYIFDEPQLLTLEIFKEFTADELHRLLKYCVARSLQKGYAYSSHPNHQHAVSIVLFGTLQVYNNVMPKISIVEPGQMHGELSIIKPDEEILLAVAREETLLIVFEKNALDNIACNEGDLWNKLHRVICTQVVQFLYDVDRQLLRLEAESHTL